MGIPSGLLRWRRGGDDTDFERVALVHLDMVYRVALRLTRNRTDAEDIVQDTYLRAFRNFHRFNPGTNCRAWLLTIMRNALLNRRRDQAREVLAEDTEALDHPQEVVGFVATGSPEEEFFQTVLHGDIDRALNVLPLPFREAVVLVDLEGLTYREVADIVGCPIGTIMSRLSRGRAELRRSLGHFAREHGYGRGERE